MRVCVGGLLTGLVRMSSLESTRWLGRILRFELQGIDLAFCVLSSRVKELIIVTEAWPASSHM